MEDGLIKVVAPIASWLPLKPRATPYHIVEQELCCASQQIWSPMTEMGHKQTSRRR